MWEARVLKRSDDKRKPIHALMWTVSNEKPSLELFPRIAGTALAIGCPHIRPGTRAGHHRQRC